MQKKTPQGNKLRNQFLLIPYRPNPNLSRFAIIQSMTIPTQQSRARLTFSLAKYGKLASVPHPYSPALCCRFGRGRRNGTGSEGRLSLRWFPPPPRRPFRTTQNRCAKTSIQTETVSSSHPTEDRSGRLSGAPIE